MQEVAIIGVTYRALEPANALTDPEPPLLKYWPRIVPGDVVLDVGAGVGLYTLPALARGARVIAFEPHDASRETLQANVAANGWTDACEIHAKALFDGGLYPAALAFDVWTKRYPTESPIPTTTIDALGLERLDWLKLDPEGAELGILMGARQTIERHKPSILVELHEGVSSDPDDMVSRYPESVQSNVRIQEMLGAMGYEMEIMPWDVSRKFLAAAHAVRGGV